MQNSFFSNTLIINILEKPNIYSNISSQILYGEKFKILSKTKKFYKIKTLYDNYIGFISKKIHIRSNFKPTHKVRKIKSKVYFGLQNKKKKPSNIWLPFDSRVEIVKKERNFIMFEKNKWLKFDEVCLIKNKEKSFLKILKLFLGSQYKWGGKTFKGIDCSALIQIYYKYNNKFFPRDTVDQIKHKRSLNTKKNFRRGNIIFWKGHVAICIDSRNLIHAYGPEKKVIIMPIQETIKRIEKTAKLKVKKIFKI